MEPQESLRTRLTDQRLRSLLKQERTEEETIPDGSVSGLSIRLFTGGGANWTLLYRVLGEGGANEHGKLLLGKKHRIGLGNYPAITIQAARAQAGVYLEQAQRGINPKEEIKGCATAGGHTIQELSELFMKEHIYSRELDSAPNYENAFKTHINPKAGDKLAELFTREDARKVMETAREKRPRPDGKPGRKIGGVEAARQAMSVLRHMYSWAILEKKVKRTDNPCSNITQNLPSKKKGEIILTLPEARIVYKAAADCGYPFGTQAQLELLTSLRLDNWASAQEPWIDLKEALTVIPSDSYKSDHVHVVPLVPAAVEILKSITKPKNGPYILSSTGGSKPIVGVSKFFRTRLRNAIIAINGAPLSKRITSHTLRRTVASGIAEILGYEGEKLVKRVLGHSDGSVTAIYNRYGYVREMRRALELWANKLTTGALDESVPGMDVAITA